MNNTKTLSSLSYLSTLLIPVIIPAIMFFAVREDEIVRYHTKRAFWSQLLTYGGVTIVFLLFVFWSMATEMESNIASIGVFASAFLYIIAFCALGVWSLFQVIKLMRDV